MINIAEKRVSVKNQTFIDRVFSFYNETDPHPFIKYDNYYITCYSFNCSDKFLFYLNRNCFFLTH
jgi:hypothetical protein